MSAIWGVVDFSKKKLNENIQSDFAGFYQNYRVDRVDSRLVHNAMFGCGHQYLTPEACAEELPIHDRDEDILFTCDGVLDNRSELLSEFSDVSEDCPDGTLIYLAYRKWGTDVCNHLLGAFAFAVYHPSQNECYLFTDHMSNRSVFYYFEENVLYFSTLIVPLQNITGCKTSEKWITACMCNTSANIALFESLTPFENIFQCMASTYLVFAMGKKRVQEYWSPLKIKPDLKLASGNDYKNYFIETMEKCVASQIRPIGQVGATLSGGLDSTTVAAFAAPFLDSMGRQLYSYTSVPLEDYDCQDGSDDYAVPDESKRVLEFCKMYTNIEPTFLSCPDKDGFTSLPKLVPLLGYPMKSAHNLTWLNEIYTQAKNDGCSLVFKGQYGNSTISYGPALSVFYQLLCRGKFRTAYKCIRKFQKQYKVPIKTIGKFMAKELWLNVKPGTFEYEDSLATNSLVKKYAIPKQINRMQRATGAGNMDSRSQRMQFLFDRCALGQLGMFDTVMGLTHGLLIRDPTKDKRVVELCARIPVQCYIAGGLERGVIRIFMQGRIPNSILLDIHHRGLQSADNFYRIKKNWQIHKDEVSELLQSDLLDRYIDKEQQKALLEEVSNATADEISFLTIRKLNVLYSFGLFVKTFERNEANA